MDKQLATSRVFHRGLISSQTCSEVLSWPDCGLVTGNKNIVSCIGEHIFRMLGFQQVVTTGSNTSSRCKDMEQQCTSQFGDSSNQDLVCVILKREQVRVIE